MAFVSSFVGGPRDGASALAVTPSRSVVKAQYGGYNPGGIPPGGMQPGQGGNQPGMQPGGLRPGQAGSQPGLQPGGLQPGQAGRQQPGSQPGMQPGGLQPGQAGRQQPGSQPGMQPGGLQPGQAGRQQPGSQPGMQPGGMQPGQAGVQPGQPGMQPGGLQPKPGEDGYETPVTRRLTDALQEADVEARKEKEEIERRQRMLEEQRRIKAEKLKLLESIPDTTPVGTVDEYMFQEGVQEQLDILDNELVGLIPVKRRVREIAALLIVDKMRKKLGLETAVPSLHMSFTGAPGTGKTTVAMRMGQILAKMGYCRSGHMQVATRDDLVGQYVGHTAPKTKEQIKEAMGGILFIDEAYYLYNASNDRDYGQESIEILLNVMESNKDDLVVVLAGYKDKMDRFYSYIPGMSSRIGNHIEFPNYTAEELVEIGKVMTRDSEYVLDPSCDSVFLDYIKTRMMMPYFSNARTVRNAVERARMRSAVRLFNSAMAGSGFLSARDLKLILPADITTAEELRARGMDAITE
ncbi:hypothetical protein NDN08_005022 [Rhodosorus marinus]|uniref:AAA+ ATPase domain-containing protein n=1 Tax=Rhodosorus marinus TaxID=101924 RepID=A0AAV8V335_9RHOD|nr:hypothetical protein NDN08_005022 [Rhodosorus marinus]